MFKKPQNDKRYLWTRHATEKMLHYGISEGRVKRIIRFPTRIEEGIAPETVAAMQPAGTKRYAELWVMYKTVKPESNAKQAFSQVPEELRMMQDLFGGRRFKVITAWRYPGESPERDPVPEEIIKEVQTLL